MSDRLPDGWTERPLRALLSKLVDGSHNPPKPAASGRPMLSARNIDDGRIIFDDFRLISDSDFVRENQRTQVSPGDILLTIVGALGRAAVVPPETESFTLQRSVAVLRPQGIEPAFLAAQIRGPAIQQWIQANAKGTAQRGLYLGALGELPVRVPSAAEQRRIIAKLEALQARSRRAREALDAVPPLLEKLRQSILAAAFRGDLTKDWRAKHKDVEPASKLLERIRAERRKKWEEAELAKLKAKGKAPTDDRWKAKYKEPEAVDPTGLPGLPEGWCWASVDEVVVESKIGLVRSASDQGETGTPYIRMQHFDSQGRWDLQKITRVAVDDQELVDFALRPGDLLFNTRNSPELVGKVALWPEAEVTTEPCVFNNNLLRLRTASVLPEWTALQMVGPAFRSRIAGHISATTSVAAIYGRDLFRQPLAIPPMFEQRIGVERLGPALSQMEATGRAAIANLGDLGRLERATLAKAFSGELACRDADEQARSEPPTNRRRNASTLGRAASGRAR